MKISKIIVFCGTILLFFFILYQHDAIAEPNREENSLNNSTLKPQKHVYILEGASKETCAHFEKCFEPTLFIVEVGTEVIWVNNDRTGHIISSGIRTVSPDGITTDFDGEFQSGYLYTNDTFSHVFTKSGEYDFHSLIYGWASGKIIVQNKLNQTDSISLDSTNSTMSPLKQFKSGISIDEIECRDNLVLIQKHDGSPACVKSATKMILVERGWGNS